MHLLRIAPVAALALSGVGLLLLGLAPLGWRLGWWHYGFGLYWMMPASGLVAAAAAVLSFATLALGRSQLRPLAVTMLSAALLLGAVLTCVPWQYSRTRSALPRIHDITTDTDNPPAFSTVLPARAAERADNVDQRDPQLAQLQKAAYPDLAPVTTSLPRERAFNVALEVAKSMPGWTVVAAQVDAGRIEASQRSRWFGFTDDIVLRVVDVETGSRIDMRSTSRQGRSDYGVNAARIRAYMDALRKRLN
jgi:uncharacterized protein (DUF1499 family)